MRDHRLSVSGAVRHPLLHLLLATMLGMGACAASDAGADARHLILQNRFFQHFTIGQDAPASWFQDTWTNNAAKWDCRVAYMSGGVGQGGSFPFFANPTGIGLPNGTHVSQLDSFILDCQSVTSGTVIPWITFYNLAQSYPANYGNPTATPPTTNQPDVATPYNAKVTSTMLAYFQLFKWTMQTCAKYSPMPIVVHLEPDSWSYFLLSGPTTTDTSGLTVFHPELDQVQVGITGMSEIADLPNTAIGFAQALKRLRDLYAPSNVLLATNPSGWDWQYTMSGARMGGYWKQMCPDWDLAAFEFGDRDQGCSAAPPFGQNCGICGTYANHIQWITDFHAQSGLFVCMWQVAVGNTYFNTCNNTNEHYCDNHIQFLLENYPTSTSFMDSYIAAGCIGWMFNAGQGFQDHVYDALNDGITNPPTITANEGHVSVYADDDGGFARLRGSAYYATPRTLSYQAPYNASDPRTLPGGTSSGTTTGSTTTGAAPVASGSSGSSSSGCGLSGLSVLGLLVLGMWGWRQRRVAP
jgi:hypothetical protein